MTSWMRGGVVAMVVAALAACGEATAPAGAPALSKGAVQPTKPAEGTTILDVALAVNAENGEFSTLIAAVQAAGFVGAIDAVGQRTVFAPTDAAFAKLGLNAGNVASLGVAALQNILLYHIAPGELLAADVLGKSRIRMANGGFATITVNDAGAFIDGSRIVATDIDASNGVIHVIDAVLLP